MTGGHFCNWHCLQSSIGHWTQYSGLFVITPLDSTPLQGPYKILRRLFLSLPSLKNQYRVIWQAVLRSCRTWGKGTINFFWARISDSVSVSWIPLDPHTRVGILVTLKVKYLLEAVSKRELCDVEVTLAPWALVHTSASSHYVTLYKVAIVSRPLFLV